MIIKSLSRKGSPSFKQVIDYINKPSAKGKEAVLHNLLSTSDKLKSIEKEFLENSRYAVCSKKRVALYHEILSFSPKDSDKLTPDIIENLTREYLKLRASNALAYAKAHYERDNIHVHILISGNQVKSRRQLRLTRAQFNKAKIDMEKYQKEHYPELENSVVFKEVKGKIKQGKTRAEREMERSDKTKTQKQIIQETILNALAASYSKDQFIENLKSRGFEFYQRGKTKGVLQAASSRKYRLKALGLYEAYLETEKRWSRAFERSRGINKIMISKVKTLWEKMRFKEDILQTIQPEPRGRAGELQNLLRTKRQHEREQLSKNFDRGL